MSAGKKKLGRPTTDEPKRPELRILSVRLDVECNEALELLTRQVEGDVVRGREAVAIRRAILTAASLVRPNSKSPK